MTFSITGLFDNSVAHSISVLKRGNVCTWLFLVWFVLEPKSCMHLLPSVFPGAVFTILVHSFCNSSIEMCMTVSVGGYCVLNERSHCLMFLLSFVD